VLRGGARRHSGWEAGRKIELGATAMISGSGYGDEFRAVGVAASLGADVVAAE
jgi:hypothetical protein